MAKSSLCEVARSFDKEKLESPMATPINRLI